MPAVSGWFLEWAREEEPVRSSEASFAASLVVDSFVGACVVVIASSGLFDRASLCDGVEPDGGRGLGFGRIDGLWLFVGGGSTLDVAVGGSRLSRFVRHHLWLERILEKEQKFGEEPSLAPQQPSFERTRGGLYVSMDVWVCGVDVDAGVEFHGHVDGGFGVVCYGRSTVGLECLGLFGAGQPPGALA